MRLSSTTRVYALVVLLYVYNVVSAPLSHVIREGSHGGEHLDSEAVVYSRARDSGTTTHIRIPAGFSGSVRITTTSGGSSNREPLPPRRSSTNTGQAGWYDSYHDANIIPGVRYTSDPPPRFQPRPAQFEPPPSSIRYSTPPRPPPRSDDRDDPRRYTSSSSNSRPPPENYRPSSQYDRPPPGRPPQRSYTTSFDTEKSRKKDREREMEKLLRPYGGKMPYAPQPPPAA